MSHDKYFLYFVIYKLVCLLAGMASIFLGYKLFIKGIYKEAGDVDVSHGETKILVKQAAPGTFFSLFGAIIISVTIWKGIELSTFVQGQESASNYKPSKTSLSFFKPLAKLDSFYNNGYRFYCEKKYDSAMIALLYARELDTLHVYNIKEINRNELDNRFYSRAVAEGFLVIPGIEFNGFLMQAQEGKIHKNIDETTQ
ncbi:MAG: hypothetical protein J0I41_00170 [Filimonas sp.]|nr:hypothetical protein [Filimonas sp.]